MSAPTKRIRVLVVDDSAFARKVLRETLERADDLEVVGIAYDGADALEKIEALSPDVITLDLLMPRTDGLAVLGALRGRSAPRVLVVTTADSDSDQVLEALEAGAVDFVHKPTALATDRLYELGPEVVEKIRLLAGAQRANAEAPPPPPLPSTGHEGGKRLIVIGTSTGGPQALGRLLPALPRGLGAAVAVALHIPPGYTDALARRIGQQSQLEVIEAAGAMAVLPGRALIARAGWHLKFDGRGGNCVARLDLEPFAAAHRPSVDVLFQSAVEAWGGDVIAVVLTGMGNDGLEGAAAVRAAGGLVITESTRSCVIDGMPRAVREAGLSSLDVDLDEVAPALLRALATEKRR